MDLAVALLTEGVDRNFRWVVHWLRPRVALLTEGVDRNVVSKLSARLPLAVALLTEGVDRNCPWCGKRQPETASPSSRRAWIEIRW